MSHMGPRILERTVHSRHSIKGLHCLLTELAYFRVGLGVVFVCRTQASLPSAQDFLKCPQILLRYFKRRLPSFSFSPSNNLFLSSFVILIFSCPSPCFVVSPPRVSRRLQPV